MRTGKLDQQIVLQQPTQTNAGGELTQAWAAIATVFAEVISEKGSEAFESARTNARSNIRVRMHHRTDVDVTWRIIWESQYYNILNVDRSGRRQGDLWVTGQAVGAV